MTRTGGDNNHLRDRISREDALALDFGGGEDIRFEKTGRAAIVTMTRPKALNALNHPMVKALHAALDAWAADEAVHCVLVKGEGRAFCAGGDIVDIYHAGKAGRPNAAFFADEYRLNTAVARFPKPYVALVDGIVMGGGVGVSAHGSHRVLSQNALFAMPETGIGFFPDVGASYFLPRLADGFGMYLGLTGNRIRRGDALRAGLATHAVDAAHFEAIEAALVETGDPDTCLARFAETAEPETDEAAMRTIAQCFSRETLEAVLAGLEEAAATGDEFARACLDTIAKRSPTSVHVAFREIRAGANLEIEDCMRMEYRILKRMLAGHDFYEGVRATLVEKGSAPEWRPSSLAAVDPADIDRYFAALDEEELDL